MNDYDEIIKSAKLAKELKDQIEYLCREGIGNMDVPYRETKIFFMGVTVDTREHDALNLAWDEVEAMRASMITLLKKLHDLQLGYCLHTLNMMCFINEVEVEA